MPPTNVVTSSQIKIKNPLWRPEESMVARLNSAVAQEIQSGRSSEFARNERHRLSERLAMEATMATLEPAASRMSVVDANSARRNTPGFDILVCEQLRIQVKGGTYVDSMGWTHTANQPSAADLAFDIEIAVDIGIILNPRPYGTRRDGRQKIPIQQHVDFYVIPGNVVRAEVAKGRRINARGAHLYLCKRQMPGTKEHDCQWLGMADWKNRFDVLQEALERLL